MKHLLFRPVKEDHTAENTVRYNDTVTGGIPVSHHVASSLHLSLSQVLKSFC